MEGDDGSNDGVIDGIEEEYITGFVDDIVVEYAEGMTLVAIEGMLDGYDGEVLPVGDVEATSDGV